MHDLYLSKRPVELRNSGRFYSTPMEGKISGDIWYSKNPMGKNTISQIMKNLVSGTQIDSTKKITNHSGRKTLVKKLKAAEIPETSIIKVTGHKHPDGLKSYDPGDEGEFRGMSRAIGLSSVTSPAPVPSTRLSVDDGNVRMQSGDWGQYVFNNCTVNFNSTVTQVSRKRKCVIYDSSQESQE